MQKYKQGLELWGLNLRSNGGGTVIGSNFLGTLIHANTVDRTYTLPDKSGTIALLSDISTGGLTLSSPLTGYTLGTDGTALADTDTILQGYQKLQVQNNNKVDLTSAQTITGLKSINISSLAASTSALKVEGIYSGSDSNPVIIGLKSSLYVSSTQKGVYQGLVSYVSGNSCSVSNNFLFGICADVGNTYNTSNANLYGGVFNISNENKNTCYGIESAISNTSSVAGSSIYGSLIAIKDQGSAAISSVVGSRINFTGIASYKTSLITGQDVGITLINAASASTVKGISIFSPSIGTGTIDNNYGIYIADQNPTGVGSGIGIYITDQSNNGIALYCGSGRVYFNGTLYGATAYFSDTITLEASKGIVIPDGAPVSTTTKLYNVGGTLYFNGSAVGGGLTLASPLTGFTLGTDGTALAATDTILQGFQKLQVQSNSKANLSGCTFTGSINVTDTTASTSSITGSIKTSGGMGIVGDLFIGGKLNLALKTSSTINGDIWSDSTRESITTFISDIQQSLTGCIFTQTADKTIATTTATDLDITGTGVGTKTLPANFFTVGKYLRIQIQGVYTSTSTASNITCKLKFGSTTIASTVACAGGTSKTNQNFTVELTIGCKSIGTSGTVTASGAFKWASGDTTNNEIRIACTTTTINTTASQDISVTLRNSANGFITTSKNMYIEVLN